MWIKKRNHGHQFHYSQRLNRLKLNADFAKGGGSMPLCLLTIFLGSRQPVICCAAQEEEIERPKLQ